MRTCSRCKQNKSLDEFYHQFRRGRLLHDCYCKLCRVAYSQERYDPQRQLIYNKRYQARHAERYAQMRAAYYVRHKDRLKAKAAIYRARRKGLTVKPSSVD